jgi:hypothetical protein
MSEARLLWRNPEQLRRRYELMDRMMQKRGVSAEAARRVDGGLAFKEARAKCGYCLQEELCRRWLTLRAPRTVANFCPNSAFFTSLSTE